MFCKKCGTSIAEGGKFCPVCGTPAAAEPQPSAEINSPVAPPVAAPDEAVAAPVAERPRKQAKNPSVSFDNIMGVIHDKMQPFVEGAVAFVKKNRLLTTGIGAGVLLLVAVIIIVSLLTGGNGYIQAKNAIMIDIIDEEVVVIWNNKVIETGIDSEGIDSAAKNLEATVLAFLTDEGELAAVKNKKVYTIAEDVIHFELSANGKGILYVTGDEDEEEYTLSICKVGSKKSTEITDEFTEDAWEYGLSISPDGKTAAYFTYDEDNDEAALMYFDGKKSTEITDSEVDLVGMGNGGKYIYAILENDEGDEVLYCYNKKGDREKLGTCSEESIYFNSDHSQVMFYNDYKTYIAAKGKQGEKICNGIALLVASVRDTYSYTQYSYMEYGGVSTYSVKDLYSHVYSVMSEEGKISIWNIKKNSNKSAKLISGVSSWMLDEDAEYLYYMDDDELCVLKISKGEKAADKAKTIAKDVDNFVVTSDRSKVYYIDDDTLYSVNGKNGKSKKEIVDDNDLAGYLAINKKDVVFYVVDGDVYACSNGRKGTKVLSDALYVYDMNGKLVYAYDEDALYVSTGSKKLKKLLETD